MIYKIKQYLKKFLSLCLFLMLGDLKHIPLIKEYRKCYEKQNDNKRCMYDWIIGIYSDSDCMSKQTL